MKTKNDPKNPQVSIYSLLRNHRVLTVIIVISAVVSNAASLITPKIIARGIDALAHGSYDISLLMVQFLGASLVVLTFAHIQNIIQAIVAERVAKDLRRDLAHAISRQSYAYIEKATPSQLLTNLTSDVDAVKTFVSQAIPTLFSSLVLIIGTSVLLLMINWRLALAVLAIVPLIGVTFFTVFSRVRVLFTKAQEVIDWLNKVINESILGAGLIRVLHAGRFEEAKFAAANTNAKATGMQILSIFAGMIPMISFLVSMASLVILLLGGHFVVEGAMTLGDFAAFSSYLIIFIFPLIMLGFIGNVMARATASYGRVAQILQIPVEPERGTIKATLHGDIDVVDVSMMYGEKKVLDHISFSVKGGTKTAIIGPTAAGKSQLLTILIDLLEPTSGVVKYDGRDLREYDRASFHQQIGFVFQDSIMFNMSIRENIAFNTAVSQADLERAIATAELADFIETLPQGLETSVSERGTSLSGGQKQRIMLARALATNPKVLLLDDFTARVDSNTEARILHNVEQNYPGITLISVTQKIAPIEHYDEIIVLMEGEVLARGTHQQLMKSSPEYVQIHHSQQSTHRYELHA